MVKCLVHNPKNHREKILIHIASPGRGLYQTYAFVQA
jgi:hypothetical protein